MDPQVNLGGTVFKDRFEASAVARISLKLNINWTIWTPPDRIGIIAIAETFIKEYHRMGSILWILHALAHESLRVSRV
jgi:hypothetical protein